MTKAAPDVFDDRYRLVCFEYDCENYLDHYEKYGDGLLTPTSSFVRKLSQDFGYDRFAPDNLEYRGRYDFFVSLMSLLAYFHKAGDGSRPPADRVVKAMHTRVNAIQEKFGSVVTLQALVLARGYSLDAIVSLSADEVAAVYLIASRQSGPPSWSVIQELLSNDIDAYLSAALRDN
jgi:hypothetical protein